MWNLLAEEDVLCIVFFDIYYGSSCTLLWFVMKLLC